MRGARLQTSERKLWRWRAFIRLETDATRGPASQIEFAIEPPKIILASSSPRRQELLKQLVLEFEIVPSDVAEEALADPWETAVSLAREKAEAVAQIRPDAIVIGADTVVAYDENGWVQLAKPIDEDDARAMLRKLSGREHVVITGVAVIAPGFRTFSMDTTRVRFRGLSDAEIADYVATGEPMDKAGGYALQGGAKNFIENTEGSWSNVVGLPLEILRPIVDEAVSRVTGRPE